MCQDFTSEEASRAERLAAVKEHVDAVLQAIAREKETIVTADKSRGLNMNTMLGEVVSGLLTTCP